MKSSPLKYMIEAFNARPLGTFIPPNWVGLAIFGFLGFLNEGFWIVGIGLEMAYMGSLVFNPRFQNFVDALDATQSQANALREVDDMLRKLPSSVAGRYNKLHDRCSQILSDKTSSGLLLEDNLNRMLRVYIRLLQTYASLTSLISARGNDSVESLTEELNDLTQKSKQTQNEELRNSLEAQAQIISARLKARSEATTKRDVVLAELDRIEQQVEYLQEQVALSKTPDLIQGQVDAITESLKSTNSWITEHQTTLGLATDDDQLASVPLVRGNKE